jgi:putative ABC transport system permease protein
MGIAFRAGRDFTETEVQTGVSVIISEAMANALYPGRSPLGQVVRLGRDRAPAEVVGVVADIKHRSFEEAPQPILYKPLRESDLREGFTLVARTSGDRESLMRAVRDAVHALAPAMPVTSIATMTERMQLPLWPRRTAAAFFLICGTLALLLATVGLFGVTYYTVRQRSREFGIRIALGARSADVVRQVLREGMWLAMVGAAIGVIAAAIAARVLARSLFGVSPGDAVSFGAAAAIEALVALIACAVPARQATQADPMAALRDV